ncbi:MAG: hypothetical protein LJE59_13100 [Chromatiaceae bacterium]|nr:hypothetical protein [Chromatiaceae bacterium]
MHADHRRDQDDPAVSDRRAVARRVHEEQHVHYTHEMSRDTSEASGRFIIRMVPLLYGVLVGSLLADPVPGLLVGSLGFMALDLTMAGNSLLLALLRRCLSAGCPFVAVLVNTLVRGIDVVGLPVPRQLRDIRCAAS